MTDIEKVIIKPLSVTGLTRLHRLFADAVRTSFTYFDDSVQHQTIRQHSPLKLLLAVVHPRRLVLSAWRNGELIGYAIGSTPPNGAGQLYWLYVSPSDRGNNTGLALLSRFLRQQRALGATTVTLATHDHRHYYERQGFKYIASEPVNGVEMDIMRYQLS